MDAAAGEGARRGGTRLVSFNLLHGATPTAGPPGAGAVDAGRVRDAVAALAPDVLALQEVDRGQPRSAHLDLTAIATAALGAAPGDARFEPTVVGTPGGSWVPAVEGDPGDPAYGIALVSRWPVERWRRVALGASPARLPVPLEDGSGGVRWIDDEPRVALAAVLRPGAPVATVIATHLSFAPGWNIAQLRRLARGVRDLPGPMVLLGDLNMPGPVPPVVLPGWRSLARAGTFPAARPRIQLDHALLRDEPGRPGPTVRAVEAVHAAVSDHRALVVDLAP